MNPTNTPSTARTHTPNPAPDPFNLARFLEAQHDTYQTALAELRRGRKESHWMWYVFPQLAGLGHSSTAKFYAIKNRDEAAAYLGHPTLGPRLHECIAALLAIPEKPIEKILGYPDDLKLKSSMTLFTLLASDPAPFEAILHKYFQGQKDQRTLELLSLGQCP